MKRITRRLTIFGLAGGLAVLVVGAAVSLAVASPNAKTSATTFKSPHFALSARIIIRSDEERGKKGSDGKWHDSFLPANFTALAGVPVKVTIYNYDDMPHTFTSPSLHINKVIKKGSEKAPSKTTFTFTPKKSGKYLWWCALPCDPWAMSHVGYMRGYVKVVG